MKFPCDKWGPLGITWLYYMILAPKKKLHLNYLFDLFLCDITAT